MPLTHLFDAELRYQDGMPAVVPAQGQDGELVGSGVGSIEGPRIRGTLRWSNFERVLADHCRLSISGSIQADDGGLVRFDAQGLALPPQGARPGPWKVASAVRFRTEDGRYRWLETEPAVWEGEFDAATATARYRAYTPAAAHAGGEEARCDAQEAIRAPRGGSGRRSRA